jgi:DNA polymerase-3 subunit alpha
MGARTDRKNYHIVLLAKNQTGLKNLQKLVSMGYLEGFYYSPRIDRTILREHSEGLIGLSACMSGHVSRLVLDNKMDEARDRVLEYKDIFEPDSYFLELQPNRLEKQEILNPILAQLAKDCGVPIVGTNDCHYVNRSEAHAHEVLMCMGQGRTLDDPKRMKHDCDEFFIKRPDEMAGYFQQYPEALENACRIARMCNVELDLGRPELPDFRLPDGVEQDLPKYLRDVSFRGLAARLAELRARGQRPNEDEYRARLEYELGVIIQMNFPGYFLIVWDFIRHAKHIGVPVGPGRGSGAGSLVAYALRITDLDPIRYALLFERFLNPERISMPDFDIDFCMDRRDEVIDYVARKYGRDRVSQIITYGTMSAKAVVRDVGRVLGLPYGFVDSISKLIPLQPADPLSLEDVLGRSPRAQKDPDRAIGEIIERYNSEDDVRDLIDLALQLEDLTRNAGKHAGGVVIAPQPLSDFCPLFAEHDGGGKGRNPVTQFDKDDVETIGLVKFDFLGLRTLTIIDWAVKAINVRRARAGEAPLDIGALPLNDRASYELFARGDTVAVFQFESRGMRELLKRAKPDTFEDIIALAALFRPGPLGSGMDREWVDRKHGRTEVSYPHPALEPVLKPTYGVIVYQEQVMQIAQVLAGYSLGGADLLRRAMGKKKPEEMAKERAKFEAGAAERGVDPKTATQIFDLMEKFAEYGFNKSHSAAYALVAYQTAWLKVHYPAEFMAAVLSSDMDNTDKVVMFLDEARALGIDVSPPDVNASAFMFEASDGKHIRYGLGAVKGVGRGACEAIADERRANGPYRDLLDFCRRVDSSKLNRRTLEALISAGALDALGRNRPTLLLQLPEVLKATEQLAREREAGQVSLFGAGFGEPAAETSGPALSLTLPETDDWPLGQKLQGERDTLGHYLSGHPLDPYREELLALVGHDLGRIDALWDSAQSGRGRGGGGEDGGGRSWRAETTVILAGQVVGMRKRGDSQAFVQLEDGRGRIECAFFAEAFFEYQQLLTRDRVLIVEGGLREDEFSGGFSLRARRCWDYHQVCPQRAQRLSLRLDLREPGLMTRLEALLARHRPGSTPLRMDLLLPQGAAGTLDLNGGQSVRVEADLPGALRALPGVRTVKVALSRPWAS